MGLAACGGGDERPFHTVPLPPDPTVDAGNPQRNVVEVCKIDESYLADRKACADDSDCVALAYRPTCCADMRLVGVNDQHADEVMACAAKAAPLCDCEKTPDRAEDGRALLDGVDTQVRCVAGSCETSVSDRKCGNKLVCNPSQICVSFSDAMSGGIPDASVSDNAYLAFACLPNPCQGQLDCSCAQSACDTAEAGRRKCEVARNDQSDVACVPYRD